MDITEKHGVKGTVALNADVCQHYPSIIEAGQALGWEWMGHGTSNSVVISSQPEAEEQQIIGAVIDTIKQSTGKQPRGWLSPALTETHRTLDLLAAAGIQYVANWVNDEQSYPMRVESGSMLSFQYYIEINSAFGWRRGCNCPRQTTILKSGRYRTAGGWQGRQFEPHIGYRQVAQSKAAG